MTIILNSYAATLEAERQRDVLLEAASMFLANYKLGTVDEAVIAELEDTIVRIKGFSWQCQKCGSILPNTNPKCVCEQSSDQSSD